MELRCSEAEELLDKPPAAGQGGEEEEDFGKKGRETAAVYVCSPFEKETIEEIVVRTHGASARPARKRRERTGRWDECDVDLLATYGNVEQSDPARLERPTSHTSLRFRNRVLCAYALEDAPPGASPPPPLVGKNLKVSPRVGILRVGAPCECMHVCAPFTIQTWTLLFRM